MTDAAPASPQVDAVSSALTAAGLPAKIRWFDDATPTAAHAAAALGIEVGAIANSLVFTLDGEPLLVLTSGAHRVDTAWLGQKLGGRVKRADAATVRSATGQVIGGVAPVGHPAPIRTVVDTALRDYPEVWAAAGHPNTVYPTTFDDLLRATGGEASPVVPPEND
ncbi:YbaK/EbsC family protein [Paramicrobacterium sp. CJ85]|uniref:YbaK/EbsC family protein n=1 Tax=Paramicrobacterium sp. CJ85 TaxID=3445355 RepID=UPI003F61875A